MARAAVLLLFTSPCRWFAPIEDVGPRPDILLVTLESTRADRIGAYGNPAGHTPNLDLLAARGTTYLRAYASSPLTLPSISTLLTGTAPPSHGVRNNGDFLLGPEQHTLAERLTERGYRTLAFTSSFTTRRRWGLDQGFRHYVDPMEEGGPGSLEQRTADEVIDEAVRAFERTSDEPLFVWVHLFDPHWPYDPPAPYAGTDHRYEGEIASTDHELARLLDAWNATAPGGVTVVTADHGEALGEGGERTHGYLLHDATLRVPLLVAGPGFEPGQRSLDPVGLVDITPTLLALTGAANDDTFQGADLRRGGSAVIYSESLLGQYALGLAPLAALTDPTGRYTEGAYGVFYPAQGMSIPSTGIRLALGGPNSMRLARVKEGLAVGTAPEATLDPHAFEMLSALGYVGGDPAAEAGTVDPRDVIDAIPLTWQARQLIGAGFNQRARDLIATLDRRMPDSLGVKLLQAQLLYHQGRLDEAEVAFAEIHAQTPSSTVALQLGALAGARSRWGDALVWYRQASVADPSSAAAMAGRVRATYMLGETERADELAVRFLSVYSDNGELAPVRAELLLDAMLPEAALEEVERALDRTPWSPWAHTAYGRVLWELGRPNEAIDALQAALELDSYPVDIRARLVQYLLELGRNAEAVRVAAPLPRIAPDDPEILAVYRLAVASMTVEEHHDLRVDRARGPGG